MVKTLKDEIVEALRDAAPLVCELSWEHYLQLAAKVESARCENCEHWLPPTNSGKVFLPDICTKNNHGVIGYGPKFGCWGFEPKEK